MAQPSEVMTGVAALANERREVTRQVSAFFGEEATLPDVAMLDFVRRQLIDHFQAEEELMWRTGYPDVYVHLEEHAKLAGYVASLRDELEEEEEADDRDPDLIAVSNRLLGNWVLTHVNTHDRELEQFLAALVAD